MNVKRRSLSSPLVLLMMIVLSHTIYATSFSHAVESKIAIAKFDCLRQRIASGIGLDSELMPFVPSSENTECPLAGFLDKQLNVVIKPAFQEIQRFSQGMAAVKIGGKWGYIDKTGKLVVPAIFDTAEPFIGGLAAVDQSTTSNGFTGYIDRTGKKVINFSDNKYIFGTTLQHNEYMYRESLDFTYFSDGLLSLTISDLSKLGVGKSISLRKKGVRLQFIENEYYCWGKKKTELNKSAIVIDSKGIVRSFGKFTFIMPFSEGYSYAYLNNCDGDLIWKGFIDVAGNRKIDLTKNKSSNHLTSGFHEGLADFVSTDSYKVGFLDKTGKWAISPAFDNSGGYFNDGFANVSLCADDFLSLIHI